VPPAIAIDKSRSSAFAGSTLLAHLRERQADGLIITGSEIDVCVLATVLDAVDLGYRVIVVTDGICSSSDEGHDALLKVYHRRFSEQIRRRGEKSWPPGSMRASCIYRKLRSSRS
jgi:nicotinamidase-related amidase